jgi:hypothetical protein
MLSAWDQEFVRNFANQETTNSVLDIVECQEGLGRKITEDQRRKFEELISVWGENLNPARKSPRRMSKELLWNTVWGFIQQFPLVGASSIDRIILKLEFIRDNQVGLIIE